MKKKGGAKSKSKKSVDAPVASQRKSVDIQKANNGYVVSQWTDKGQKTFIAKTTKEAQAFATKLLGVK